MPSTPSPIRGRFAPTPSGLLHLGHAQTALLNWLQVRAQGGQLILRIEDVDSGRRRSEADAAIPRDLAWLGLDWDEGPDVGGSFGPYRQSERDAVYAAALSRLAGRVFPCTCTRKEVRAAVRAGTEHRGDGVYPGTCRGGVSHAERDASLRLRVEPGLRRWTDLVLGPSEDDPSQRCGDFIVKARSGDWNYQLACVVDDIAMGITDVLRGQDLADSTSRQLVLYEALGAPPPRFAHVPLRLDDAGVRLAKSRGSRPIAALREEGEHPEAVLGGIAADLGLLDRPDSVTPLDLVAPFIDRYPNLLAAARFAGAMDQEGT